MNKDLPLDVIRAVKTINDYMTDEGYLQAQITYIGVLKFETKLLGELVTYTPIAQDMMMLRLREEDEANTD